MRNADYIVHVFVGVILYESETLPIKEEDVIRLQKNDARMVR